MSLWQYSFHLIPREGNHLAADSISIKLDQNDEIIKWNSKEIIEFSDLVDKLLTRRPTWNPDLILWGEDSGNEVQVLREYNEGEISIRLDTREINYHFVSKVVSIIKKVNGLIVDENGIIFRPSYNTLLKMLKSSSGFRFVSDPGKFLSEIDKE